MANPNETSGPFMNALYRRLLERGISYFLPKSCLEIVGSADMTRPVLTYRGQQVELVDVQEWARPLADVELPVPSAARYQAHSRATLCGGHTCLILNPNGEIKIFAEGAQVFNFLEGRWRLTDAVEKYRVWKEAAERPGWLNGSSRLP
jgi:hypothetical protein